MINNLVKKENLSSIVDMRNNFIPKLKNTLEDIKQLQRLAEILLGEYYRIPDNKPYLDDINTDIKDYIKSIDGQLWIQLLEKSIKPITSSKRYSEIYQQVRDNPIEFTEANIVEFLSQLPDLQKDLVTNLIESLYKRMYPGRWEQYKTNKKAVFSFPKKYIYKQAFAYFSLIEPHARDFLNDLQKLFLLVDNKTSGSLDYYSLLSTKVEIAAKEGNLYEDEYFKIKTFKNGNIHITMKREDLINKINEILFKNCNKLPK